MAAITVEVGDITMCHVDAIVNAANAQLLPGGGVCGAIHRAGGPSIAEECQRVRELEYPGGVQVGGAVATAGGRLPARYVIHAVGPVFAVDSHPDERLAEAYRNSLQVARDLGARSIAFPSISTGIYGFPAQRAAPIVQRTLQDHGADLEITLVFFSPRDRDIFQEHRGG